MFAHVSHLHNAAKLLRSLARHSSKALTLFTAGGLGYSVGRSEERSEGVQLASGLAQAVREAVASAGDRGRHSCSSGAVAGALGACCGVGLIAATVLLVARKKRRQKREKLLSVQVPSHSGPDEHAMPAERAHAVAGVKGRGEGEALHPARPLAVQHSAGLPQSPATPDACPAISTMLGPSVHSSSSHSSQSRPHPMSNLAPLSEFHEFDNSPFALAALGLSCEADTPSLVRLASYESNSSEVLLSRLQSAENDWQDCILDPSSIEVCRTPDGGLVELGKGAFSTVFKVIMDGVQPHAVKVLELGEDLKLQDEFIKEACLLRQLRHRNIVSFAGVCVDGGCGFIVMELMDGGDLRSRLQLTNKSGERVFSWWNRGRTVALDVARGLHYIHSKGYTHFDLKSANVLLTRDLTAKLADVGFARVLHRSHHSLSTSRGTFDYMAPEVLLGRHCDASVDIYSMGCLIWEICSGKYPARGSLKELAVPRDCPQGVADLVEECMAEDPSARPTARALVERLEQLQQCQA